MSREAVNEQELKGAVLGSIKPLTHVVDEIQDVLEGVYGLADLRLRRASQFLWPRQPSVVLKHNFKIGDAVGTNFSTDWDIPVGAWDKDLSYGPDWYRESKREKRALRLSPRRIIQGRFHFQDLHPSLYVAPNLAEQTQGVTSLDQMLTEQQAEGLELITMGVSMFLNAHTQYLLHREIPGRNTGYGMTLVDFYHVVRESSKRGDVDITQIETKSRTGRFRLMRTLFGRQGLEQKAFDIMMEGIEKGEIYYNPLAKHYTESTNAFEGFIYYLIDAFNLGRDISSELRHFYRLKGVDKRAFLAALYYQRVAEGDERYKKSAEILSYGREYDDHKWGYVDHRYKGL